jgi:hypothetical protein
LYHVTPAQSSRVPRPGTTGSPECARHVGAGDEVSAGRRCGCSRQTQPVRRRPARPLGNIRSGHRLNTARAHRRDQLLPLYNASAQRRHGMPPPSWPGMKGRRLDVQVTVGGTHIGVGTHRRSGFDRGTCPGPGVGPGQLLQSATSERTQTAARGIGGGHERPFPVVSGDGNGDRWAHRRGRWR